MNYGAFAKRLIPESLLQRVLPRGFQAMSIGTPKSGTTSVARLFHPGFRSDHEPERRPFVTAMQQHFRGVIDDDTWIRFLRRRDRELWLEMESNCFLGYRPDLVMRAFPTAQFVLTVREPRSWLRSMIDNHIDYPPRAGTGMRLWHDVFFRPDLQSFSPGEAVLREHDLYPARTYLAYWVAHNQAVLEAVPTERLMVLGTREITPKAGDLADFLGIDLSRLNLERSHANTTPVRHGVFDNLDPDWIDAQVEEVCGDLIARSELATHIEA